VKTFVMLQASPHVAIVDDDASVRKALARLLGASSFHAETFCSAYDFLDSLHNDRRPSCLVVDLQMPGMDGLELQQYLTRVEIHIPTVIITAHDEASFREQCCAAGALAYLLKPLDGTELIAAIHAAVRQDREKRAK
jgi:FixJ family two-component response regulator